MRLYLFEAVFLIGLATKCLGEVSYEMRFESIVAIEGEEETKADFRQVKLIGRERLVNGSIYFHTDSTDDYLISFEVFLFKNSAWTSINYGAQGMTPCEFFKHFFIKYFDPDSQTSNFPKTPEEYCPLSKGEYWIINLQPSTGKWVTFMRRGLLKLIFKVTKMDKVVGGFECVANIIDRPF